MPYITQKARKQLLKRSPLNTGELNYKITKTILSYLGSLSKLSYDSFNYVFGVLEDIKQEIAYREWGRFVHEGDLRTSIYTLIRHYLKKWPHASVHEITQVRGVLSCVSFELYRRQVSAYEDLKMKSNGDVFDGS